MKETVIARAFLESWGDIVDRSEPYFDDIAQSYQRQAYATMRRDRLDGRFLPVYDNELDLAVIRAMARLMHERVPMAKAKTRRLVDYTISKGFDWTVEHEDKSLGRELSGIVKRFFSDNKWTVEGERDSFEQECVDGEWLGEISHDCGDLVLNLFNSDCLVEPANTRELDEWLNVDFDSSWTYGVLSKRYAPQRPKAYHIVRDEGGIDYDVIPARRMLHWRRNVPAIAKRGYSDAYTTHVYLGRADKVLANTAEGAAIQAAIAYIVEHVQGTTSAQATNIVKGLLNMNTTDPVTGNPKRSKKIVPGQRVDIPAGMKYHAGLFGSNNASIYIDVMESLIRLSGTIEAFPEHMLTGDAGNNNFASSMVAESPFVQGRLADQEVRKMRLEEMIEKVIRFAVDNGMVRGRRWSDVSDGLKVTVQPPSIVSRDPVALTQSLAEQITAGLTSKRTASQELGRDYDQEQANIKKEAAEAPAPAAPGGMPGMPAPGQPGQPIQGQGGQAPLGEPVDGQQPDGLQEDWDPSKHPRGKDGKFISAGVDFSKWNMANSSAQWAKKKIEHMEKLAADEQWDAIKSVWSAKPGSKLNQFQKGIMVAQDNLLKQKDKALAAKAPSGKWEKLGGSLGTQPGGTYELNGKKYYVKSPNDPEVAKNEVLAFKLYQAVGTGTVTANLATVDGKLSTATLWMESTKVDWNDPKMRAEASKDFATHAWLANWDAIGAGSENPMDNIRIDGTGKLRVVDAGGSLTKSGMGSEKPFGMTVGEWDTLRNPAVNPTSAKVFGDMTPAQLAESGKRLESVTDKNIDTLVDQLGPDSDAAKVKLKATLKARRDDVLKKVAEIEAGLAPAVAPPPAPAPTPDPVVAPPAEPVPGFATIPQAAVPDPTMADLDAMLGGPSVTPVVATPMAIPVPPQILSAKNQGYAKHLDNLHSLAKSGDVDGVKNYPTNATSMQTYAKKVHKYKMEALAAMGSGAVLDASPTPAVVKKPAKAKPKIKINAALLPLQPTFISSNAQQVATNKATVETMASLAAAGDLAGLEAMDVASGSPKVANYHYNLVAAVKKQLVGPGATKTGGAVAKAVTYAGLAKDLPSKPAVSAEKVGYWAVVGKVSVPEAPIVGHDPSSAKLWDSGHAAWAKTAKPLADGLKRYTGGAYGIMNDALRADAGTMPGNVNLSDTDIESTTNAVQGSAKAAILLQPNSTIYRKHDGDMSKITVGLVVADAAILSTSTNKNIWSGQNTWILTAGHGVKGAPADSYSKNKGEMEVVLPPNTRMLVTQVQKNAHYSGTGFDIHAVILPNEDAVESAANFKFKKK